MVVTPSGTSEGHRMKTRIGKQKKKKFLSQIFNFPDKLVGTVYLLQAYNSSKNNMRRNNPSRAE